MRRRLRSHEGANAVEFALVLPILVMLIFGAITAGLTLNVRQQLDHAAREGARFGATLPVPADIAVDPACGSPDRIWHECVRDQVDGSAVGTVNIAVGSGGVCVSYFDETTWHTMLYGDVEDAAGNAGDNDGESSNAECFSENPALTGSRVQVKVEAPARLDAVLVRTDIFDLVAKSVSRYEEDD